jgi:parvulin-like peptidyl-prolyl isomerase
MNSKRLKTFLGCVIFLTLFSLIFYGCKQKEPEPVEIEYDLSDPAKKSEVILMIGQSDYANSDFEKYLIKIAGDDFRSLPVESLSRLFDDFIDEKFLLEAAKTQQISLSKEEEKDYLARLTRASLPSENNDLLDDQMTMSQYLYEELIIEKYIVELVKDFDVSEEEIQEYYQLNKRDFLKPERIKLSQILAKSEDKAIEILNAVKNENEEFFRLTARKDSIGVEAIKGGEMGIFSMGQLPYEMEKVVFSLKEGEISRVFESSYGYHVFRLDEKFGPELVALEEVSSEIRIKILDKKIKNFVSNHLIELKARLDWSMHPRNLTFPYQRIQDE